MKKLLVNFLVLIGFVGLTFANQGLAVSLPNQIKKQIDLKIENFIQHLDKKYNSSLTKSKILKQIIIKVETLEKNNNYSPLAKSVLFYLDQKLIACFKQYQKQVYSTYEVNGNIYKGGQAYLTPISPIQYQKMLKVGINVNWNNFNFERKNYTSSIPKLWKEKGFYHVRIRFKENVDIPLLKKQVEDSLKAGLIPVVAFGAEQFKLNPDEAHLQQAVNIWKKVATALKNEDYRVSFDLMIEPGKNLKKYSNMLYDFYDRVISAIRSTGGNNKYRILFLAPNHLANPEYLNDLTQVFDKHKSDKYLMAQFHFLAAGPFRTTNKTGKRLTWTGTGTIQEKQKIVSRLKIALDWQKRTGRRIWFGAWMPGNYNHTYDGGDNNYSIQEQVAFAKFMEQTLCKMGIPNAVNADSQFYDMKTGKWKTKLLPVIEVITSSCK